MHLKKIKWLCSPCFSPFNPKGEYSTLIASPIPALTSQKQTLGERCEDLAILK